MRESERCQSVHTTVTWFRGEQTVQCEKHAGHGTHHLRTLNHGCQLRWPRVPDAG